ncbi:MAG: nuclear transport factor 2 family protein [Myxococcota bacterium]|nr:nuclear transport factor 2 family protein [Myxococcota bacterium]
MIESVIEKWMTWAKGDMPGDRAETLDTLLAEDVTFFSPVVFTPQKGKAVTKLYLMAAFGVFGEGQNDKKASPAKKAEDNDFAYVKKVLSGQHAVLEFETTMDGKYVNGVDIISCNEEGLITEFKVMVRPLQAMNTLHAQMGAMLKKMQGDG